MSEFPPNHFEFDEVYTFWSQSTLRKIGYLLHLAALDKAQAWAKGNEWLWTENDIVPELKEIGDGFYPSTLEYEELFFTSWDEDGCQMSIEDLKHQMEDALTWPQIDAMKMFAISTKCSISQRFVRKFRRNWDQ